MFRFHTFDALLALLFIAMLSVSCPVPAGAMTMQPVEGVWMVDFQAHPDNERLDIFIECRKGDGLWTAALVGDLDPTDTHIRVRQPKTPEGWGCSAIGRVMRNAAHDHNEAHQTIGESTLIRIS